MQHTHTPRLPAAPNDNSASAAPRRPGATAPHSPPAVHTGTSNKARLTYPATHARVVPPQDADRLAASARVVSPHGPARNDGTVESHARNLSRGPGLARSGSAAGSGGCHLGPDSGRERVGSRLGPSGGWGFGGGVQGQLGGMSAGARAERVRRELFRDALSLIGRVDAGKASELKERWERECGALEPGH